jgi:hypothetical protein
VLAGFVVASCGGDDDDNDGQSPDPPPPGLTGDWSTDFSQHSVPLSEFIGGGPPKDGIPSIDDPKFVTTGKADDFLADGEPVAVLEIGGQTRLYPIQILVWHEIVNDEVGGEPVAVTYCPLCNSTVAFERTVDGEVLDFGTTGRVRKSDLVMYDRQTESWWQQLTAEAVVGELTGKRLEIVPSGILSWGEARRTYPDAEVLSRDTGAERDYGSSPYPGYDDPDSEPFLLEEEADGRLPAKTRVTSIATGDGSAVVYPLEALRRRAPLNDRVAGRPVVILFDPDVVSALDGVGISSSREVGAAAVFDRRVAGRTLTFEKSGEAGTTRDRQTGTTWDIAGKALDGPLAGDRLRRVVSDDQFWFAVAAFLTDVEIRTNG